MKDLDIINIDYSAKDSSYLRKEVHTVSELPDGMVIPDEGPFYVKGLVVKSGGLPLTINKDFTIEGEQQSLELKLGKKIALYIRLKPAILNDSKEVTISYQKVGDGSVSMNYLLSLIEEVLHPTKKYDWNKDIIGIPDTFAPAKHYHDITSNKEVIGFGGLVTLLIQATNKQKLYGLQVYKRLQKLKEESYASLNKIYQARWDAIMAHIHRVDVPHPMTKATLGLGNHPNYGTATVDEDKEGKLSNVLSTPAGLKAAIENYNTQQEGYVRQGVLPFSYYGTGIYIPPAISGSFEGLGSNTSRSAYTFESNGWLTMLARAFDGKVNNLYIFYNKNPASSANKFINSGYQYTHPTITAAGCVADSILAGTGDQLIAVGEYSSKRFWIGLSGGTFDPAVHTLKEINIASIKTPSGFAFTDFNKYTISIVGNWVYLFTAASAWNKEIPNENRLGSNILASKAFFRFPISDLTNPNVKTINFSHVMINYQRVDRSWVYNQEFFVPSLRKMGEVTNLQGEKVTSIAEDVFIYRNGASGDQYRWEIAGIFRSDPSNINKAKFRMINTTGMTYTDSVFSLFYDMTFCLPYDFDVNSSTLTLDSRYKRVTVSAKAVPEQEDFNYKDWHMSFTISRTCLSWISNYGYGLTLSDTNSLPWTISLQRFGLNTDWSDYEKFNLPVGQRNEIRLSLQMDSPFPYSTNLLCFSNLYYVNNQVLNVPIELFNARNTKGAIEKYYHIPKSDNYEEDPRLTTKYITKPVLARKSSIEGGIVKNPSFQYDAYRCPFINYGKKGSKYSLQYGMMNIGNCWANKKLPFKHSTLAGPTKQISANEDIKVYTLAEHTLDSASKVLTVTPIENKAYIIKTNVWINAIKMLMGDMYKNDISSDGTPNTNIEYLLSWALIVDPDAKTQPWSVVYMIWHYLDGTAKKSYKSFALFKIKDGAKDAEGRTELQIGEVIYPFEQFSPKGDRVGFNNYQLNDNYGWQIGSAGGNGGIQGPARMEYYPENDDPNNQNFQLWTNSGIFINVPGWNSTTVFKVQKRDGVWNNGSGTGNVDGIASTTSNYTAVPQIGLVKYLESTLAGGASSYATHSDYPDKYILMGTVVMEGQWTLFVNSEINITFNGTIKKLSLTSFDLSELNIDPKNKTFYLYAVSGKAEGYYELTLKERTSSPYHILAATIYTNELGIVKIDIDQGFYISGFKISTSREGGIVPASVGTPLETGSFKAISDQDLFDRNSYSS